MTRRHTTHHDDCGCLSARYEAELAEVRAELARRDELAAGHPGMCCGKCAREISEARAEVEAMRKVVDAAVAFRDPDRDPEAEPLMLNLWTAVDAYFAQHGKPCPLTGKERVT